MECSLFGITRSLMPPTLSQLHIFGPDISDGCKLLLRALGMPALAVLSDFCGGHLLNQHSLLRTPPNPKPQKRGESSHPSPCKDDGTAAFPKLSLEGEWAASFVSSASS